MIIKMILTSLFALLVSTGLVVQNDSSVSGTMLQEKSEAHIVKALVVDGEAVPHVDLPTVEVTAKRNTANLVTAEIIDGEVVPVIRLDEVIITPGAGMNSI